MRRLPLILLAALPLVSCASQDTAAEGLTIFATTGYLADAAKNLAPNAEIITMVGPGGDPHTYQPTTKDIEAMKDADLVLWNGLHLEAQMIDQLEALGDKQLAVGEQISTERLLPWEDNLYDPHIWNSPDIWQDVVRHIAAKLGEVDADNSDAYTKAADTYTAKIADVAATAEKELRDAKPRVLITGHDAFNYFGKTFDFQVHATDFVSTEAAKSAKEISELADLITYAQVPVIFQDNQANPQAITSLKEAVNARGRDVTISSEELFADTLGAEADNDEYLEVFAHNAHAVAEALK